MSVMETSAAAPVTAGPSWTQAAPARWVATVRAEVIGAVREGEGRFTAYDERAILIGSFDDLETAQRQVQHPASRAYETRLWRREQARQLRLAWTTMWIALTVLVASVVMVVVGLFL